MENKTLNNVTYDIIEIAQASGRVKGIANTLRSINRVHKQDVSTVAYDLSDIADQIDSALATLRHTLFPLCESECCCECKACGQECGEECAEE